MEGQAQKKRIYKILNLLKIGDNNFETLGSYDNPDFEYWGDIDVDHYFKLSKDTPARLKKVLSNIKKFGPELGFKFLGLKLGISKDKYFRSNRVEDYENRFKKNFNNIEDARDYAKSQYQTKIDNLDASEDDIRKALKYPSIIKLDLLIESEPNFTVDLVYKYDTQNFSSQTVLIRDLLDDIDLQRKNGKYSKVIKRLYSIAKIIGDRKKQKLLSNMIKPYGKEIWLTKTLEIPQNKKWENYVESQNIDINKIESELKQNLVDNYII